MSTMTRFELRKPVTPYVCSTPLDFVEEREFLSDVVFPKLNDLCKSRGSYFHACDFKWKPGDAKSEAGLLLKTSLDAAKQCSPFFLGLLGETYGPFRDDDKVRLCLPMNNGKLDIPREFDWLDKNLVLAGSGGHSWVLQEGNQYKSITELEVMQGALLHPAPHTTLYYRRSDHLDSRLPLAPNNKPDTHTDVNVYSSESEQAHLRIHDLRQRLVNQGVSIRYFGTLEELGQLVLEDWTQIIDMCLPPLLHDVQLLDTSDYQEWLDQQIHMNRLCELFVSTPDAEETLKQLTEFAQTCSRDTAACTDLPDVQTSSWGNDVRYTCTSSWGNDVRYTCTSSWGNDVRYTCTSFKSKKDHTPSDGNSSIVLMAGDRGTGKSVLVAHWLKEFKADNPHICVISHFVSASCRSRDVVYFLEHSTRLLRQQFLLSEDYDPNSIYASMERDTDTADDTLLSTSEAFVAALSLGPCVILLDGVSELNSHKQFDWLPECLPTTCRLILTSASSDVSRHYLSQRSDVTVIDLPASLKHPSTTVAMVKKQFPTLIELIGERAMTRLVQLKLMQTALGSKLIGSRLLCFSGYSKVNSFLEEYAEVWSLREFWTTCVQNWVTEYSWTLKDAPSELSFVDGGFCYSGWVIDCLCLIALSRNGLTQDQILSILKLIGYDGDLKVTSYEWLQFRVAASATLQEVGDGRLVFGHRYIQEIAEYLLFGSITASSHNPGDILRTVGVGRRHLYHTYLARYFSQQLLNVQTLQELPWHLMFSGDVIGLVNCLTNWNVLLKLMSADSDLWLQDLKLYWSFCEVKGHRPELEYLKLMRDVGVMDISDVQFSESVFVTQSRPGPYNQRPALTEQGRGVPDLACLGWFLAEFLERIYQGEAAKTVLLSLINYLQQKPSQTTGTYILLSRCHHVVGQFYETSGDLDTADKEYKLALRAVMAAIDLDDEMVFEKSTQYVKGLLLNCLGNIRILKGHNSEAGELLDEALDGIHDNPDCLVIKSAICYSLGVVCFRQCNYTLAEAHLRQSARLRSQWFGSRHPLVAEVLLALAKLFAEPRNTRGQDLLQAKNLYKRALHTQEKWFGAAHLSVASVLYELGSLLAEETSRLSKVEARDCLRRSLDIRTTSLGSKHPLTISTQQTLTRVCMDLQLKNYEFGSVRRDLSSSARTSRKPPSAATLPESGRLRLFQKDKRPATAYSEVPERSVWSQSHEGPINESRPDNIVSTLFSLTSASERLLSAPITEIPRLLYTKKQGHSCQGLMQHITPGNKRKDEDDIQIIKDDNRCRADTENEFPQFGSSENINHNSPEVCQHVSLNDDTAENVDGVINPAVNGNSQTIQKIAVDIQRKGKQCDISKEVSQEMLGSPTLESYSQVIGTQNLDKQKKRTVVYPASAPQRLLQRYRKYSLAERPQTCISKTRRPPSSLHPLWSGRSNTTAASSSSHLSHCKIPGRHDITVGNTQSISGPHSDLASLLGDPPCPRPVSNSFHHMSAWYHVPGRYATPQHKYPSKRMQRTKTSRDIESYIAQKVYDFNSKQKESHGHEDLTNQSAKENLVFNGPYLLHTGTTASSSNDNFSVYPRFVLKQNSATSLMVSGLEVPRTGHPGHGSTGQSPVVQFKKTV